MEIKSTIVIAEQTRQGACTRPSPAGTTMYNNIPITGMLLYIFHSHLQADQRHAQVWALAKALARALAWALVWLLTRPGR